MAGWPTDLGSSTDADSVVVLHDRCMSSREPVLAVRHLSKRYGAETVVDDLSFSIGSGEVVGLIGPNGAGKSTVMKSLVGLVRPSGGHFELLGHAAGTKDWHAARARVGAMIEAPPLYGRMTARQNLRYQMHALGLLVDESRIDEILELVGLRAEGDDRPKTFSLGMKQRLGIGVCLVGNPELVILDEPANGLDPAGIRDIRSLLQRLPDVGVTVLVSSHQLVEVEEACDSLVVLDRGRLVVAGSVADVVGSRQQHVFEIVLDPTQQQQCLVTLERLGHMTTVVDDVRIEVRPDSGVLGRDLLRSLSEAGLFPDSLSPKTVSLEDAFLEMTTAR